MKDNTEAAAPPYRFYVLFVLTLIYVVNYLDRQILGILLPYIQKEFVLDDFQGGLLSGTVFAAIYATLSVPLATLADRMNRRNIIAASLATFSLMTVLSGYAGQAWQLVVTRFCTGIGEAGTGPSINSMIADLYPPQKRAGALSFYSAGLNIGLLFGFFGGSWMLQHYGWRSAFIASGAPGLLLVVLLLTTVREPKRGLSDHLADTGATPTLGEVIAFLWTQRSFRWIALGCAMSAFGGYANLTWLPKFLIVSHHMTPIQIGIALSLLTGTFGALGTWLSGVLADRFSRRDINWYMYVPILCTLAAVPFAPVFYLVPSTTVALCAAIVPALFGASYLGPSYAMAQGMVPLRMRAQTVGILLFVLNILALGLGPATVGLISVLLKPTLHEDSLRYALLAGVVTSLLGAFCYWRATRTLKSDLARGSYTGPAA
ncbi:MAG: MFS transporter [Alphaproteobacteria bacterium]|nr:MFS transporter [Alphaproteobacteria bacterium]